MTHVEVQTREAYQGHHRSFPIPPHMVSLFLRRTRGMSFAILNESLCSMMRASPSDMEVRKREPEQRKALYSSIRKT